MDKGVISPPPHTPYIEYCETLIKEYYPEVDMSSDKMIAYHVREISKLIGGDKH